MLFAVLGLVRSRLSAPTHPLTRLPLSASRLVPSMDATAARTFATLANSLCSRGIQVGLGGESRLRLGVSGLHPCLTGAFQIMLSLGALL